MRGSAIQTYIPYIVTQNRIKPRPAASEQARLELFRPITERDMGIIFKYLSMEKGRSTDFSYGGLLMWVNYFKYEYAIVKDTLFIKGVLENHREVTAFSMPVGLLPLSESVAMIRDYCNRHGLKPRLSAVPEYAMEEIGKLSPASVEELTDWADYLYEAETLATLRGKKMGKKRNHVNKFDSLYPEWQLEELTEENADDAMRFMDKFDLEGDSTPMAIDERKLTRELLAHSCNPECLEEGAILRVGGEVAGFTLGDVKGDTLYVHVEKCTRDFEGSYEKINKEFAAMMMGKHPEIKYINREDDSGDEGLRLAKESYHPVEKLKKYNILF